MTAGIVEGPDHIVRAAHDDDAVVADLVRDVTAGLCQLAGRDREQPIAVPDRLKVETEDVRVPVERLVKAVPFTPAVQQSQKIVARAHLSSLRCGSCPMGQER